MEFPVLIATFAHENSINWRAFINNNYAGTAVECHCQFRRCSLRNPSPRDLHEMSTLIWVGDPPEIWRIQFLRGSCTAIQSDKQVFPKCQVGLGGYYLMLLYIIYYVNNYICCISRTMDMAHVKEY